MKIINEGAKETKFWWVNKVVTCNTCARKVQLEKADAESSSLNISPTTVTYHCENCGNETVLNKKPQVITETVSPQPQQSQPVTASKPAPVGNPTVTPQANSGAAPVGNKTSQGWGNPFQGTSWGLPNG